MFKRILVPLDGSDRAERAIPVAARVARALGDSVILLRVVTTPVDSGPYIAPPAQYAKENIDTDIAGATSYLQNIAKSDELVGITTEVKALFGAAAPTILSAAQSFHANIIVMCSHGYTGYKRWVLGSVADKVTRHSPIPVLVLREGGPVPATAVQQPVRALVSVDGSPLSEAVLEPAAYLAAALAQATSQQCALHLLRVVDLPTTGGKFKSDVHIDTGVKEQAKHEDEAYLATLANRLREGDLANLDLSITYSVEVDPDVAEAIVKKAEQDKFDFIAMATHGRGGVQHWAMGSVSERVLHATRLPLLIMRPQDVQTRPGSKAGSIGGEETGEKAEGEIVIVETTEVQVETWSNQ
jgi:nucleotide-binding universal stress UspA family protein